MTSTEAGAVEEICMEAAEFSLNSGADALINALPTLSRVLTVVKA